MLITDTSIIRNIIKSKRMQTQSGHTVNILSPYTNNLYEILLQNRKLHTDELDSFFHPKITDLHDPFLMPDMEKAVQRIL